MCKDVALDNKRFLNILPEFSVVISVDSKWQELETSRCAW